MNGDLDRFALLADLSERDLRVLSERLEWLSVEPATELFCEGDPADALLLVAQGRVRVWSERRETEGEVAAGASLGALSLVVEGPREATARARTHCTVLRLTREAFRALRESEPATCCRLLEGLVRESAGFARDALAHMVARSAERRAS